MTNNDPTIYRLSSSWTKHEDKRGTRLRPSLRRWKHKELLDAVRQALYDHAHQWRDQARIDPIYVEVVAAVLRARQGMVDYCFALLNKEGLLTHRVNSQPHDSKRSRFGSNSGWQASMYFLTDKVCQ